MNPHAFALLMLGVVAVALGFSGYYFQMAVEQARPILPAPLQDEFAVRFALDRFIWSGKAAAPARRSYLRSHVFGCIAIFWHGGTGCQQRQRADRGLAVCRRDRVCACRQSARLVALSRQLTQKATPATGDRRRASRLPSGPAQAGTNERPSLLY